MLYLGSAWWIAKSDLVHYVRFWSGDLKMLCWVYIVDGARAGRCAASAATTSIERSEEVYRNLICMHDNLYLERRLKLFHLID